MSYYDKIIASNSNKKSQPRHSKKLINLDDQLVQEEEKPDIFGQFKPSNAQKVAEVKKQTIKAREPRETPVKVFQLQKRPQIKNKIENSERADLKLKKNKNEEIQKQTNKIQFMNKQQIEDELSADEPEVHGVSKKSWLSIMQSFNLSLGHYFYTYNFPIRREIPIIANNLDLEREKYQNGTYISESFDNNLQVSFFLFFLKAVLIQSFMRVSVILWIVAIVLTYMIDSNQQYRAGRQILLGIFLFYCLMSVILQFWSLRGRRIWQQPSINTKYKVYHFDNETRSAEWVMTDVADLRPGNIYKVPPSSLNNPSVIPADSVLLHSPRTILQVDESLIIQYLSPLEKQQRISLKQTLIKTEIIMLPLTGVIHYQLAAPQIVGDNIYGRFSQQQPAQQTFNIGYSNVVLRGTKILSSELLVTDDSDRKLQQKQSQILAVVLETGIDSLVLKTSQYPYQYRKQYTYTNIIDNLLIVCSIIYLLITGAGVLIGYIYLANQAKNRGYYIDTYLDLGETPITLSEIILHHFGNLIMIAPILIRISYLLYINTAGRIANTKMNIQMKDYNMLAEAKESDVLVTTIGSDLIRMGANKYSKQADEIKPNIFDSSADDRPTIRNRSLQSIRVSGIHHNFFTTRIDNQMYSNKDVDMICYFMSIALLTCNRKSPSPLEGGIIERCNKQLNVKIQKFGTTIKIGQLKVIKIFTMPATEKFPFKIVFYRHAKQVVEDVQNTKQQPQQKVLGLIRGQTSRLSSKISEVDGGQILSQFSSRLHQEKGYHIELLGKFVLSYEQFLEIKRAYMNSSVSENTGKTQSKKSFELSKLKNDDSMNSTVSRYRFGIDKFYDNLDRYMPKIDPMGLLIWQNPYSVLSSSLSPISSLSQPEFKIIIAPASKSQTNPQFESVHAITNYLLKTSKLSLKQISNKILHNYINQETFWSLLNSQKMIILNGWDYRMIKKMLSDLKEVKRASKKPVKLLAYIEQDQYAWVLKQSDVSISTKGDGHDLQKYSDILINPDITSTTTDIIRRLFYYSYAYSYCLKSIIIVQFMKAILLATVEFINLFYTWGTALVIIGSPLYLIIQVGLLLDFLYHLYPRIDTQIWNQVNSEKSERNIKNKSGSRRQKNNQQNNEIRVQQVMMEMLSGVVIGCFITFIPIYSMTEPPTPNGTVQPKQFTNLLIHFILYHVLVLRKIFMKPYTFSIYKLFVLIAQVGVYYIGIVIVSAVDSHQYQGVIWFMIQGKIILIAIFVVWMVVGVYWLAFMIQNLLHPKPKSIKNSYEKIPHTSKKQQELSVNQVDMKVGQVVDIE